MEFHLELAQTAGFPLLTEQLRSVWTRHLMQLNWVNASILPVPDRWHEILMAGVETHDPDAAESVMREHVRYGQRTLSEALQRLKDERNDDGAP